MRPLGFRRWSVIPFVSAGLLLSGLSAWAQSTTPPPPPAGTRTPTAPVAVPPSESEEKQIIISGTISMLPFSGCPSTALMPSFQVQFLGLTVGVATDDTTVVHDRTLTGPATGADAILQAGQFVDVIGTVAGSCLLADRVVIRSNGHLVVRGNIASLVGNRIVVQGATFEIDSNTKIFGPRGSAATLADLSVGTFVRVGGPLKADGTYLAKRIHIGFEFVAEGPITRVGSGGGSITVAGRDIVVPADVHILLRSVNILPEETARGGQEARPVPGGQPGDASLLQVGTVVAVFGQVNDGANPTYSADRIFVFGNRRVTFEGTVGNVTGTSFTLEILPGLSIPVNAGGAKVRGRLADGVAALVIGQFNSTGGLDAFRVVVRSRVQFVPRGRGPEFTPPGRGPDEGRGRDRDDDRGRGRDDDDRGRGRG